MSKNTSRIKAGIRQLVRSGDVIISGTVVSGSVDSDAGTLSVLPSDGSDAIEGVLLGAVSDNGNGLVLLPKDGTNVVIACVDGPGEWAVVKTSDLESAKLTIGSAIVEVTDANIRLQNNDVELNLDSSVFKINTASESLYQLLKDCFTYLSALTVSTPAGTSSVPVNVTDFNNLLTRLDNLLTH